MDIRANIINAVTADPGRTANHLFDVVNGIIGMPDLSLRLARLCEARDIEKYRPYPEAAFQYYPYGKAPAANKPQTEFRRPDPLAIKQAEFYSASAREASAVAFVKKYPGCTAVQAAAECKEFDSPVVAFVELSKMVSRGVIYAVCAKEETQFFPTPQKPVDRVGPAAVIGKTDPMKDPAFVKILATVNITADSKRQSRRERMVQPGTRTKLFLDTVKANPGRTLKEILSNEPAIGKYSVMSPVVAELAALKLCERARGREHSKEFLYFPIDVAEIKSTRKTAEVIEVQSEPLSEREESFLSKMVDTVKGVKQPEPIPEPKFTRERAQAGEFFHANGFMAVCISDGSVVLVDTSACTAMRLTRDTIARLAELIEP